MHHSILAIVTLVASTSHLTSAQQVFATQCYYKADNQFRTSGGGPCGILTPNGNFSSCCSIGDTCLADGLCQYAHPKPAAPNVATGYYVGGCNDQSLDAQACNPACNDLDLTDIVYNQTTNTWHCCGVTDGILHCDSPTAETFVAPAPSLLTATYTVPATAVTASATSTSSSTSSTSTPTPTSSSSSSGGLSTGAQAGIGVGCAIAGLAIIGVIAFFLIRRRRQQKSAAGGYSEAPKEGPYTDYKAGGGVGAMNAPSSPGYQSTYAPQTPAPQYGTSPGGYTYSSVSPNTASGMTAGAEGTEMGMYKSVPPAEGMSSSLAGGKIEGVGANGAPVQEKMSENVATTQPQEMEGGDGTTGVKRGRSVRYEME